MKEFLYCVFIFILISAAFSSCSSEANSQKSASEVNVDEKNEAVNVNSKTKSSEFPPLAEKIVQAELSNLDKSTSKIADRKGKVVLLNMWATWCGPCRSEMPTLVRLQEDLGNENFEVIGLNADDESVEVINPFKEEMKLNYTLAWPSTETQSDLMRISKAQVIPQSFLVDRDGRLRGVFVGANPKDVRKMDKLVREIVAE